MAKLKRAEIRKSLSVKHFHTLNGSEIASKLKLGRSVFGQLGVWCSVLATVYQNYQSECRSDLCAVSHDHNPCLWQFCARCFFPFPFALSYAFVFARKYECKIAQHWTPDGIPSPLNYNLFSSPKVAQCISHCVLCRWRWTLVSRPLTQKLVYLRRMT